MFGLSGWGANIGPASGPASGPVAPPPALPPAPAPAPAPPAAPPPPPPEVPCPGAEELQASTSTARVPVAATAPDRSEHPWTRRDLVSVGITIAARVSRRAKSAIGQRRSPVAARR